ncbi:hypothetical protein [Legionella spiritensis]|uniref:Alpha-amylase n=1 Tax=Legionella spiritensis TaxID=452 RepID=A0A0W0Z7E1_LEGSP|nr:hypothetical protein [Legionella spiritensis]KTD64678.1 alpha-amylase [Legionella spiritensis]SNV47842.1 alpha-amylase [Legionella spiritensis]
MSSSLTPSYPANGILKLYNMFPYRLYESGESGIDDMIRYIPEVASMNYNAIWINPLQLPGTLKHPHPDGKSEVSGSLYAMADEHAFNPLIFPGCQTQKECEGKLRQWTATARFHGLFPLFDLVLNHVGIDGSQSPLQKKLADAGLLLDEVNERWPDIQGIDYYRKGSKSRGLNTEPQDLDYEKIDRAFTLLWEPLIRRYICDYGFMGVRVDALTHIPAPVQQRAYRLVKELVRDIYGTDAILIGELMVANPEVYLQSLSICGLTHSLNPCAFYWGHNMEGGYANTPDQSAFCRQNEQLAEVVLSRSTRKLSDLKEIVISGQTLDHTKKQQKNTIYIYKYHSTDYLALNTASTDICFGTAVMMRVIDIKGLTARVDEYNKSNDKYRKRALKKEIAQLIYQSELVQRLYEDSTPQADQGGLVGVVGNHDVGTLKAKMMLDIAYSRARSNAGSDEDEKNRLDGIFKEFKNIIKGITCTNHLMELLQQAFHLTEQEKIQLFLDLNMRMREKIFIESMMCMGGWYSLGGDEFGVCHKPEVFAEFAMQAHKVGSSLAERRDSPCQQHDFRSFISGINTVLGYLPQPSYDDKAIMNYAVLDNEAFGEKPADLLFMVLRYNSKTQQYHLVGHCRQMIGEDLLSQKIKERFVSQWPSLNGCCRIYMLGEHGELRSGIWANDRVTGLQGMSENRNSCSGKPEKPTTSESVSIWSLFRHKPVEKASDLQVMDPATNPKDAQELLKYLQNNHIKGFL